MNACHDGSLLLLSGRLPLSQQSIFSRPNLFSNENFLLLAEEENTRVAMESHNERERCFARAAC